MAVKQKAEVHFSQIVACLAAVAKQMGITADEDSIARTYEQKLPDIMAIKKAVHSLRLTAKLKTIDCSQLAGISVPTIAIANNGDYVVIVQINEEKLLIFEPQVNQYIVVEFEQFIASWSRKVIIFNKVYSLKDFSRQFNLKWFIPVMIRYKRYFLEILGAAFLFQVFGLVVPLCTQVIIDKVIGAKGDITLTVLGMAMIFVIVFKTVMNLIRTYLFTHTTNKIDVLLGTRMLRHILYLPIRYFETRRVGDIMMRIGALNNIREFLTGTAITVLVDLVFSSVFFIVMFFYSIPLALVAIMPIPLQILINVWGTPHYQQKLKAAWDASSENHAFVVEAITGINTIKSLAVEPQMNFRWERLLAKNVTSNLDRAQFCVWLQTAGSFIQKLFSYLIIWCGGLLVIDNKLSIGQFIAFQMLFNQAGAPVQRLIGMWQSFQQAKLAMARIGDVLNAVPEPVFLTDAVTMQGIQGEIRLQDVSFRYNMDSSEVLKQINLYIRPGMKVGIVGKSGSGKSTLSKIIQRLYMPESGQVYIDNINIAKTDPVWLRRQIGVVLQENYLFNGSIRENIAFACKGANLNTVIEAAKLAGAHDFIIELPQGYDTIVGERGSTLSGGQCQRIAIARALISNPKIILFDEATSALDAHSERIIMENIEQIGAGRTMLIIAHRLTNVMKCDRIVVMDQGQIVELGTHAELIQQKGHYYNLYNQQGGCYV